MEVKMKNSCHKFLAISFLVSLLFLAACGGSTEGPSTTPSGGDMTPTSPPTLVPTPTPPPPTSTLSGLSPKEVQLWCTEVKPGSGACDISHFMQLQEFNGAINPKGIHFKANAPAKFN